MGFGVLYAESKQSLASGDTQRYKDLAFLLDLPTFAAICRRFYKSHPVLKPVWKAMMPSVLREVAEGNMKHAGVPILRHTIGEIAKHEHATSLEIRELAELAQELLANGERGLRSCEDLWTSMEARNPTVICMVRLWLRASLSECKKQGCHVCDFEE